MLEVRQVRGKFPPATDALSQERNESGMNRISSQLGRWITEEAGIRTSRGDFPSTEHQERWLAETRESLLKGSPLQYLLGHWAFRGLDLKVDGRCLIPRPETEMLVEIVLSVLQRGGVRPLLGLEIGVGSGAISLSIAQENDAIVMHGSEISLKALEVAQENLRYYPRLSPRVRFVHGDILSPFSATMKGQVDLVVSNPPYLSQDLYDSAEVTVRDFEPKIALTPGGDGLGVLEKIASQARDFLREGGVLAVEHSPEQAGALSEVLGRYGYRDITQLRDLAGRLRFSLAYHLENS